MRVDPATFDLAGCRRILVCGPTGSGKSTLARAIAGKLELKHIELDSLYHEPNWQSAPDPVFFERIERATQGDAWVVDGNYSRTRRLTLPRADLVIWLHFRLGFTFRRLLWRTVRRCWRKELLWDGCRESWKTSFFSRESILLWLFKSHALNRTRLEEFRSDPRAEHIPLLEFREPKRFDRWVSELGLELGSVPAKMNRQAP